MAEVETVVVKGRGISVDLLVWRRYGVNGVGKLAEVLGLNPGLADQGPLLAIGTKVLMPVPVKPSDSDNAAAVVRLWD